MIGVIVGLVSSLVIFTFYQKDQKAVKMNKERKQTEQKQKQQIKKKQQQELELLKNDPFMKKRREQQQKQFQEKFIKNVDEKDKQIINQYLEKHRSSGKNDEEIMKQASNQANLFMGFMFVVVITLVMAICILNGVQPANIKDGVMKFLGQFFPKIRQVSSSVSEDL